MKINYFTVFKAVVICIAIAVIGSGIFYFGFMVGAGQRDVIITGVKNQDDGKPAEIDFRPFWETWALIRSNYFASEKVDNQTLVYGAIEGLVNSLGDPHSVFFSPEDTLKFTEDTSGEFGGVGMEIGIRDEQLMVISPIKDTPAERAGVKAGDFILKMGDKETRGLSTDEAVKLIRGPKGSEVTLQLFREGWDKPQEFKIIRSTIVIPSSKYTKLDGGIARLELYNFNENVPLAFYKDAVKALADRPKGIILDLRNNPGGYLEVSVDIAGWFTDRGAIITKEQFRSGESNVFRADGNGALKHLPVVVLVNEGSASAAEILAGALRDLRNAPLVGIKTFGKGSVQEVRSLSDGSSVKISIAQWLTPNGSHIEKVGLEPEHKVELSEEDAKNEKDPQLDKAIEVLRAMIK